MGSVLRRIREFLRDKRGAYSIMFIAIGSALLMGAAMSIDVARMFSTHSKLVFAVDAAALATTQGLTQGDIALADAETWVRKYLDANLDGKNLTKENVTIDKIEVNSVTRTVRIDAHAIMPMTMTGIVGYNEHRVDATTTAKYADTDIEVAMALDITGSMGWKISSYSTQTKLQVLKAAAKSAIDTLFDNEGAGDRIRVGLVPYSEAVNAHPVIDKIETTGLTKRYCSYTYYYGYTCWYTTTYPDCVAERTGAYRFSDRFADSTAKITSSGYSCPSSQIVPLSADKTALKNRIDYFSAGGNTAGHVAIAWAYYLLSSKWNSAWPSTAQAASNDEPGVQKYAIIMTDGEFNTFETADEYGTGATDSKTYALGLCDAMKTDGIKIYSIAFASPTEAKALMRSCASTQTATATYFFDATDEAALADAFRQIAEDIRGLRLVN